MTNVSSTLTSPSPRTTDEPRDATEGRNDSYSSLFEQSGLCMAELDRSLRVREASEDFCEQFGRTCAQVRGLNFIELVHPSTRRPLQQHLSRLAEGTDKMFVDRLITVRRQRPEFLGDLRAVAIEHAGELKQILVLLNPAVDKNRVAATRRRIKLSPMDAMIVESIASGQSSVNIANKMYLSRQSVEYHVSNLIRELKVANRTALIAKAYSLGILTSDTWPPRVHEAYIK